MTLALLAILCQSQDDPYTRLRDQWPKLVESWKAISDYQASAGQPPRIKPGAPRPDDLPDELVRMIARTSAAMEAAGLWDADGGPDAAALRLVFKTRLAGSARPRQASLFAVPANEEELRGLNEEYQVLQREIEKAMQEYYQKQGGQKPPAEKKAAQPELEEAVAALARLGRGAEEDLIADAVARVRKAMRDAGIFDDATPTWVRVRLTTCVRALSLGEKMPELARPTPEQEKRIAELIEAVETADVEARESAVRELTRMGEPAVASVARKLAASTDTEVKARLRRALGHRK